MIQAQDTSNSRRFRAGGSLSRPTGVPANRLLESILAAFAAIRANKMRALLTSLGIMIGVMNVVAMVALISGVNRSVMDVFRQMGTNTFTVTKMPVGNVNYMQMLEYLKRPDFTFGDAEAIGESCPAVLAVSPQSIVQKKVRRGSESTRALYIVGVTPEFQFISDSEVADGRFFAWPEADRRRQVAVIGDPVREHLFAGADPIGKDILIGNRKFRVTGAMEPAGEMFGQTLDDYVIIPFRTLNKLFGSRLTTRLSMKATSGEDLEEAMDQVTRVLRQRRGLKATEENNFEVVTQSQLVEMYENLTRVTWIVMIGISAIALVVGGVGIMNIMMVSVTERTREIGIRKAVGARARDVAVQFLVEAAVLSGIGGLLGLLAAVGLAKLISSTTPIPASIELWSIILALGVSTGVGVFFGLYPASKAAKLDPIVALRYE
jgi:putative ABC transport system permease protein